MDRARILVIGAGVAGLSAALSLVKRGYGVYLVERQDHVGGNAASYGCKARDFCLGCGVCAAEDLMEEMAGKRQEGLIVLTRAEVDSVREDSGNFAVTIAQAALRIDPERCTACGICREACPRGAIFPSPRPGNPQVYRVDEETCTRMSGGVCEACVNACPSGAINFGSQGRTVSLEVRGIIVATGFEPADPRLVPELGYGRFPGVFAGPEVEALLRDPSPDALSVVRGPRIAFIQCVGSRNVQLGRNYCSEVCCKYALRMGSALKSLNPGIEEIAVFYTDLQTAGKKFPDVFRKIEKDFRLVRGVPTQVRPGVGGTLTVKYEDVCGATVRYENFNTVILSTGIWPRRDARDLAAVLGINTDEFGFFAGSDPANPFLTNRPGIITAGCCQRPCGLSDSIASGEAAAMEMIAFLEAGLTGAGSK